MEGSIAQDAAHENLILKHRSKGSDYNYKHTPCHIRHGTLLPRYRPPCLGGKFSLPPERVRKNQLSSGPIVAFMSLSRNRHQLR